MSSAKNHINRPVALVTGASGGIGAATALALAGRGYAVALGYRKNRDAALKLLDSIEAQEGTGAIFSADLRNSNEVEELFSSVEGRLGPVELLVNSAGTANFGLLTDMTDSQWQEVIDSNLSSVFYCCRRALPGMIARKQGCIVNIGSVWGEFGASCEAAYSAAKAGVDGITMALAREVGPSGIRVNCIAPGLIETPMNRHLTSQEKEAFADSTALGRPGLPEEVAHGVLFFADNGYTTGQILRIDGGY